MCNMYNNKSNYKYLYNKSNYKKNCFNVMYSGLEKVHIFFFSTIILKQKYLRYISSAFTLEIYQKDFCFKITLEQILRTLQN